MSEFLLLLGIKPSQCSLDGSSQLIQERDLICFKKYYVSDGLPGGSKVKNLPASVGDTRDASLIPVSDRSPGAENGNPLQYSYLENSMDREAWWATVHGVTKSQTQLSVHVRTHTHTRA